jgi:hypothetical protein
MLKTLELDQNPDNLRIMFVYICIHPRLPVAKIRSNLRVLSQYYCHLQLLILSLCVPKIGRGALMYFVRLYFFLGRIPRDLLYHKWKVTK